MKSFGQFVGNKIIFVSKLCLKFQRAHFLYLKIIRLLFPVTDKPCEGKKISVCFKRRAAYLKANNSAITTSVVDKRFFLRPMGDIIVGN